MLVFVSALTGLSGGSSFTAVLSSNLKCARQEEKRYSVNRVRCNSGGGSQEMIRKVVGRSQTRNSNAQILIAVSNS
jgi:hypothetical protein